MEQSEEVNTKLAEWLTGGLGAAMRAGEILPSLVSCQRCRKLILAMGDGIVVEAAARTAVSSGPALRELANSVPDLDTTLSTREYQEKAKEWFARTQGVLVLRALDRAATRLASACREDELPVAPAVVHRNVFVLALLAYLPGHDELKSQLGAILGCSVSGTDRGILEFLKLAVKGDEDKVARVDQAICADPAWDDWPSSFLSRVRTAYGGLVLIPNGKNKTGWDALWNKLLG